MVISILVIPFAVRIGLLTIKNNCCLSPTSVWIPEYLFCLTGKSITLIILLFGFGLLGGPSGWLLSVRHGPVNLWGFPRSSVGKESACNAGDSGSIPGSETSAGEGNGNPL